MLHATSLPAPSSLDNPIDLLFSVLEHSETGLAVIDPADRAIYMNSSARSMLESPLGLVPS